MVGVAEGTTNAAALAAYAVGPAGKAAATFGTQGRAVVASTSYDEGTQFGSNPASVGFASNGRILVAIGIGDGPFETGPGSIIVTRLTGKGALDRRTPVTVVPRSPPSRRAGSGCTSSTAVTCS